MECFGKVISLPNWKCMLSPKRYQKIGHERLHASDQPERIIPSKAIHTEQPLILSSICAPEITQPQIGK